MNKLKKSICQYAAQIVIEMKDHKNIKIINYENDAFDDFFHQYHMTQKKRRTFE